jgi:hypothetical protein
MQAEDREIRFASVQTTIGGVEKNREAADRQELP